MWVDQGKDSETNNHAHGTGWNGVYPVVPSVVDTQLHNVGVRKTKRTIFLKTIQHFEIISVKSDTKK